MTSAALLAELQCAGFAVTLAGENIKIAPSSRLTNQQRESLREQKAQIVELLKPKVWAHSLMFQEAKQKIVAALDAMTDDERQVIVDALDERTAILMLENGFNYQMATRTAEQDLLALLVNKYSNELKGFERE